ncbi:MAG: hypothetical protein HC884_15545 [Chloroflexaceae bacterium]|nr:hypothetical protein [Chloroflexaceae bacterium]
MRNQQSLGTSLSDQTSMPDQTSTATSLPTTATQAHPGEKAMMLVGTNQKILVMTPLAAHLLGTSPETIKGRPLSSLMDGSLSDAVHRPAEPGSLNLLQTTSGRTVIVTTRKVTGQNHQPLLAILFEEIQPVAEVSPPQSQQPAALPPAIGTLQSQIQNLQELITMIPQFSHNRYWQTLLVEHMDRIVKEMRSQVQYLTPLSA